MPLLLPTRFGKLSGPRCAACGRQPPVTSLALMASRACCSPGEFPPACAASLPVHWNIGFSASSSWARLHALQTWLCLRCRRAAFTAQGLATSNGKCEQPAAPPDLSGLGGTAAELECVAPSFNGELLTGRNLHGLAAQGGSTLCLPGWRDVTLAGRCRLAAQWAATLCMPSALLGLCWPAGRLAG